jgi:hypothetical protein
MTLLLYKAGLIDGFSAFNILYNTGTQYAVIVLGKLTVENHTEINLREALLEPFVGMGVGIHYVNAGKTELERRARVATLAALFSTSASAAATSTPSTNGAIGTAILAQISHMKKVLNETRGGGIIGNLPGKLTKNSLVKSSVLEAQPYRTVYAEKSKKIITNIFNQHTQYRYEYSLAKTGKKLSPLCSPMIVNISIKTVLGYCFLGAGLTIGIVHGGLYLIRESQEKHYKVIIQPNEKIIDVSASLVD